MVGNRLKKDQKFLSCGQLCSPAPPGAVSPLPFDTKQERISPLYSRLPLGVAGSVSARGICLTLWVGGLQQSLGPQIPRGRHLASPLVELLPSWPCLTTSHAGLAGHTRQRQLITSEAESSFRLHFHVSQSCLLFIRPLSPALLPRA